MIRTKRKKTCWAILGVDGAAIAIAPCERDAVRDGRPFVQLLNKVAVGEIRTAVYAREGGNCVKCGKILTPETMHLHEKVSLGDGGWRSVENCESLCYPCHIGPIGEHRREPRFTVNRV